MAERVWTKASKFCQSVRDGTHSSPKPSPNGRLLITSKHIVGGRVDTSSAYLISENEFNEINKRSKVDQWDVLITMIGTVGDVCLVIDEPNYAIKNIGLFKTGGELEGRWLFNWLRSEEAKALLHERLAGTTQAYISLGALREFPVPLLPAADMREVNILLGSLGSKIELNRRMNETMEAMAQAIFRDWFVDFGPVRRKMAGATDPVAIMGGLTPDPTRATELAALFPDALDVDDLPMGWQLLALSDVANQTKGSINPQALPDTVFEHYSLPAHDSGHGPAMDLGATIKSNKVPVPSGSVMLSKLNPEIPRVWIPNDEAGFPQIASTEFLVFKPKSGCSRGLLYFMFRDPTVRQILEGMVTGTSKSHQRISPPALLQTKLVVGDGSAFGAFDEITEPMVKRLLALRAENRTLAETRDYLLPRLMSGEVRVGDATLEIAA
ncbi:restriction endonuclease subunit S [Sphingobium cupriresistens]|uniref:Restriction endonuclease subunit S n=1 Tax=Sphingobium cupriresistens TaxID=1132417 RepID=A0A8G1ZHR3_9SPHN|nr:restriction endonuclease subunit S [Sphingobium cupriresistens]RYM12886.1 restriction endonuclease subunit S [Sphingobium cupriresistens]